MANEYRPLDERNKTIVIDFETRSAADIRDVGADKYAEHRTTEVLCLAYTLGQSKQTKILTPAVGSILTRADEPPLWVRERYWEKGYVVEAWNVGFEIAIWRNVCVKKLGWPDVPDECWRDTMLQAAICALPLGLGPCGAALQLDVQKNEEGKAVMMKLSRPRKQEDDGTWVFYERPSDADFLAKREGGKPLTKAMINALQKTRDDFETLYNYCIDDVRSEREIMYALPPVTDTELKHWQHTQLVNKRGVFVNEHEVDVAVQMIREYEEFQNEEITKLTEGFVRKASNTGGIKQWMETFGIFTDSVDKAHVVELLARKNLPDVVREVLTIRQEMGKASTAKLKKFKATLCRDKRFHGALLHHGATTGRYVARGNQIQNLPRGSLDILKIEQVFKILERGGSWKELLPFGNPMDVLSSCLRAFIQPQQGKRFLSADFANIEGRVVAWVAEEETKLDKFRAYDTFIYDENGKKIPVDKEGNVCELGKHDNFKRVGDDIYKLTAGGILNKPAKLVDKHERNAYGKVSELSLGFGGSFGAFKMIAKTYDISLPDDLVKQIVDGWRALHPNIMSYMYDNYKIVMDVIRTGNPAWSGKIYHYLEDLFLCSRLPSGRILRYAYPRIEMVTTPWGKEQLGVTYMTMKKPQNAHKEVSIEADDEIGDAKWIRIQASPGIFTENYTQAIARDIMVEAAYRCEFEYGYPITMSIHDELVAEVPEGHGSLEEFEEVMARNPEWCPDLPIACEGWEGYFYRK